MTSFAFRIRLHDPLTDEEVAVEEGPKGHFVGFERDAASFLDAVLAAITRLTDLGFDPLAVEDELVSMADIAQRTGRSRQSVSMLVSGQRGPGGFPHPVAGHVRSPLWHWADISSWFESDASGRWLVEDRARTIASINGALANRVLARERPGDLRIQRLAG